jgi:hypothetical protein
MYLKLFLYEQANPTTFKTNECQKNVFAVFPSTGFILAEINLLHAVSEIPAAQAEFSS